MKNTSQAEGIFRKKGFFIALYSCLGVVAVLAVVITFANRPATPGTDFAMEQDETTPVGADQVDSYLAGFDEEAWFRPRQPEPEPPQPPPQVTPPTGQTPPRTVPPPTSQPMGDPTHPQVDDLPTPPPEPAPPPEPEATSYEDAWFESLPSETMYVPSFMPFSEGDRMEWPLVGVTVMPFSGTALVYDPTLDQFRTNDNLRIAANEGDVVRAGAYGRVIAMGRNVRQGNYIQIDHGNGWVVTYGQLAETEMVREGDIVYAGQIIGGVGQPSIFGSAHGPHLHLRVEHDDIAIDPYEVLALRDDF